MDAVACRGEGGGGVVFMRRNRLLNSWLPNFFKGSLFGIILRDPFLVGANIFKFEVRARTKKSKFLFFIFLKSAQNINF